MTHDLTTRAVDDEGTYGLPAAYEEKHASLAVSLARAEVDQQITTARAFPRSITRAVKAIMTLATLDEETAGECIYALPRSGKAIRGPSVRLAEIVSSQWGNCRVGARVVHVDRIEKYVEAEGVFHDLETNTATTARVRRRLSNKQGKLFDEDMIVVTGNAACAIAKRNAILGGVPKAAWRKAYEAVESVVAGDVKTLSERRDRALKAFAAFGVTPDQVFAALGIGGLDDVTLEHMGTLTAMHATLKNGEATVEEMFATQRQSVPAPQSLVDKMGALAKKPKQDDPPHDPTTGEIVSDDAKRIVSERTTGQATTSRETPAVEHPSDVETDGVSREPGEVEARSASTSPTDAPRAGDTDPRLAALLEAGGAAADKGTAALRFWIAKLSPPDNERVEPYLEDMQDQAEAVDEKAKKR